MRGSRAIVSVGVHAVVAHDLAPAPATRDGAMVEDITRCRGEPAGGTMTPWSPRRARRIADVRRSLWFLPTLMASCGVLLGVAMPRVDAVPDVLVAIRFGWLRGVLDSAPAGAQQLLATSAGALATILGVAFSLTLVTLQLATAQYTPRAVARLLEDHVTKVVLGSYIGTVAYLLLVLRSVHGVGANEPTFVPRLSLLLALGLILACLALLAYFVHHLGSSMQATNVGARIADETIRGIRRLQANGRKAHRVARPVPPPDAQRLPSDGFGYVQLVDVERLASAVPTHIRFLRVEVSAGDYVLPGMPVLTLWPCGALAAGDARELLQAFALGVQRADDQDVLFGVRQLADVGLRALSPAMNDETTAVTIVNQLGAVLSALCSPEVGGDGWSEIEVNGIVVFSRGLTLRRIVDDAFSGLVRSSSDHPRVLARIVEVLADVAVRQPSGDGRDALQEVADWVDEVASRADLASHERTLLESRVEQLRSPRLRGPAERPHELH